MNQDKQAILIRPAAPLKRILFGLQLLEKALKQAGYQVSSISEEEAGVGVGVGAGTFRQMPGSKIYVGIQGDSLFLQSLEEKELFLYHSAPPEGEGFYLGSCAGDLTIVSGGSETGALYGCLELSEILLREGAVPREIAFGDAPAFRLRGPSLGLQKTKVEPPRLTYEYPITPSRFPWFYDKALWQDYLDMMLRERCNVVYIWSGHPFSSLVKLPDYPEALEVTEEEYQKNREVFEWLTEEADKRGIWVVLKFYNIHIPLPFSQKHGIEHLQSRPTPLVADYTRKSIAQFVHDFPHIGLMVCLGETLRGTQNEVDWFTKTILPGVKDGMKMANLTEEPPVILRGHDTDPKLVMEEAKKIYSHLYTMWKYNGEGLTTWLPRGKWQKTHLDLSALKSTHIMNVHVVANLEPFRFAAPSFIQKCVQAGEYRLGTNGLHLYPLFYWDWPYSPDKREPRLRQLDRDWMWYSIWFRYAWNPKRDPQQEKQYWTSVLADHFAMDEKSAALLLEALESAGECAPRLLRRYGITEGNRQTMSLGMTMSELTNVKRYNPNIQLWESVSPQGERPDDYVQRELKGEPHLGETPMDTIRETAFYAQRALDAVEKVLHKAGQNQEELERTANDIRAIYAMTHSYNEKVMGALDILRYKYTMGEDLSGDLSLLKAAVPHMEKSLEWYRQLTKLTEETYLYANSMQTPQRKIPFPNGEIYGHWTACLPLYTAEVENFKKHLEEMKQGHYPQKQTNGGGIKPLSPAPFTLLSPQCETYTLEKGCCIFSKGSGRVQNCAEELNGLTGIRFDMEEAIRKGVAVEIDLPQDSRILIGYFHSTGPEWLQVPKLETNTHADDRGGLSPVLKAAMYVTSCPSVNIHAFYYEKGRHEIFLGTGAYMIAGVIPADQAIAARNADLEKEGLESLDWLYEAF